MVSILAFTFLFSSICFFLRITMTAWHFPIGTLAACALSYYFLSNHEKEQPVSILMLFGMTLGFVLIFVAMASYFYDISFDGQAYHMEAMIQMKHGWNPFYEQLPNTVNQALWVNHYAKGMETVGAAINCTFNTIEAGKAANFMIWLASFFFTLSFILRNQWTSVFKAFLLSFIIACNPIVLNQLLTYYVDGPMGALLLCLIILGLYILQTPRTVYFFMLFLTVFLLVNVKFTAVLYIAVFIGGYLIWALWKKNYVVAKQLWWTSVVAGLIAIVCGFNPYITNTVNFGHPLYPLMGKNKVDIIYALNLPAGFENKNGLERFFTALFSRTDNIYPNSIYPVEIKVPFTFNKIDLAHAPMVDSRLGGFGPMFSGIVLLSIILAVLLYLNAGKEAFIGNMTWGLVFIIISIIVMPESWWARYVPQFWLLPLTLLLTAEVLFKNRYQLLKICIYTALVINLAFCSAGFFFNMIVTSKINYQLALLKSSSQTVLVDLGESKSNRIRFSANHIPYRLADFHLQEVNEEYMAGSQACFIWPSHTDKSIKEPWILKTAGKWLPFMWQYYGR
ncbi:MAG: hypothetical protein ABWY16_05260 [Pedobacter sp.]|uniref:hypothetical protein n=1 Tax=Pedobacter sp. TaxID=1411316 RepID=UPI00339AAA20